MKKPIIKEHFEVECSITADLLKAKNITITYAERRIFTIVARKIADNTVNQLYDAHNNQIVACCDFLIQEIKKWK